MDVHRIRRENLRRILAQRNMKGADLARLMGKHRQYIYGVIGKGATRDMGHGVARQVEAALGLAEGELDLPSSPKPQINDQALNDAIVAVDMALKDKGIFETYDLNDRKNLIQFMYYMADKYGTADPEDVARLIDQVIK